MLGFFIFTMSEFAKGMSSVQRLKEYIDFDDFEAEFDTPATEASWPKTGDIAI